MLTSFQSFPRNSPCPCGSGKKFKRCCIDKKTSPPINKVGDENYSNRSKSPTNPVQKKALSQLNINRLIEMPISEIAQDFFNLSLSEMNGVINNYNQIKGLVLSLKKQSDGSLVIDFSPVEKKKISFFFKIDSKGIIAFLRNYANPGFYALLMFRAILLDEQHLLKNLFIDDAIQLEINTLKSLFLSESTTPKIKLDHVVRLIPKSDKFNMNDPGHFNLDFKRPSDKNSHPFLGYNFTNVYNYQIDRLSKSLIPPSFLGRLGNSQPARKNWTPLYFIFSDKTALSLDELIFHPYSLLLDSSIMRFIASEYSLDLKDSQLEDICLKILNRINTNINTSFVFVMGDDTLSPLNTSLTHIPGGLKVDKYLNLSWGDLKIFSILPEYNQSSSDWEINFIPEIPDGLKIISQIDSSTFLCQEKTIMKIDSYDERIIFSFENNDLLVKLKISAPTQSDSLQIMSKRFIYLGIENNKISNVLLPKIQEESIKLFVDFNSTQFEEGRIYLKDISNKFIELSYPILTNISAMGSGGLAACLQMQATDMAVMNPAKRPYELKFYKHAGVYFAMISTFAKLFEKHYSPDKCVTTKDMNTFVQEVFQAGVNVFTLALSDKDPDLKGSDLINKIFSYHVKNYVFEWVRDLWAYFSDSSLIAGENKIYKISNLVYFKFLQSVILSLIPCYDGKSLLKLTNSSFELDFLSNNKLLKKGKHLVNWALNLDPEQALILINGEAIESIEENRLTSSIDVNETPAEKWFGLHPKVYFDGVEIDLNNAFNLLKGEAVFYRGKFYRLKKKNIPTLDWLEYFWKRIQVENESIKFKKDSSMVYLPKSEILTLFALKKSGIEVRGGEEWKKISSKFDDLEKDAEFLHQDLDQKLSHIPLRHFQKTGVKWLVQVTDLGMGGILADDMGLGKTLQALSYLEYRRIKNQLKGPVLIVLPTSLIYNWVSEAKKFTPHLQFEVFQRKNTEQLTHELSSNETDCPKFILATYGQLVDNEKFFHSLSWAVTIFDEAQMLKNISSKRTGICRLLKSSTKICLTGTPMENHYGEFFSLIDLILPGALGEYSKFRQRYIGDHISKADVECMKLATRPLVLRRKKEFILTELPEKTETVMKIDFSKKQQKIYRDLALSWNDNILQIIDKKGERSAQVEMLTALLRLRQACSYPQLVPNVVYEDDSPKEELLLEQLDQLIEEGQSVLVFCHFKASLDFIEKALAARKIKCFSIYGEKTAKERQKILEDFNQYEGGSVLIMTLKTGGVGLNLVKASYVIHFEPWWNPAVEDQATDRAHRIGQKKAVQVYRYVMSHSIEERIQELKNVKQKAFDQLFEDNLEEDLEIKGQVAKSFHHSGLTQADFQFLLS